MTKQEAIEAMKSGKRVTHRYFSPSEWMESTQDGSGYRLEDGVECSSDEFWHGRMGFGWQDGWEIIPYTEFAKANMEPDYKALYLEGRELIEGAIRIRDCWGVGPKPIPTMNQGEHEAIMKMEDAFKAFLTKHNDLTNHKDGE